MALPYMLKHRKFPSGLTGTGFQFTLRRANPRGVTALRERVRHADRAPKDRKADAAFLHALWHYFGTEPFERGNLDAGRLSWLLGREVEAANDSFDPEDYETLLKINIGRAMVSFPEVFEG